MFDSLFNQNVKTKIEKKFLKLLKQHYPKHLKLIKIQKNTVKLSYCYMSSIIKQHNVKYFLQNPTKNEAATVEAKNAAS